MPLDRKHVLSMLPVSRKERTRYIHSLLMGAKEKWGLTLHGVCQPLDRDAFGDLIAPDGKLFVIPHFLEPAPWESDPAAVEKVASRIREAELRSGVSMGKHVLACAHSIGRAFNVPFRFANKYPLLERITSDNEEPFRIMRRLFIFADDALEEAKPDLVLSPEWVVPVHAAFWMAATARSIPCVTLRNSKLQSGRYFWSTHRLMWNENAIADAKGANAAGGKPSEDANRFLQNFREKPKMVSYISARWKDRAERGFLRYHFDYLRATMREFKSKGQDLSLREPGYYRLYRYYRGRFLFHTQKRFFKSFTPEELAKIRYVYIALHKEAELAQTFQASAWHDQRNTIRLISSLLPSGYRLLVREHRMNYSLRPTRVYKELAQTPNLTLINPFDSQFKYIQNAELVVTENGSTGWEAIIFGRRLITLATTFYDGAELGTKVDRVDELNETVLKLLSSPAVTEPGEHDRRIGNMLDAEKKWTFPGGPDGIPEALNLLAHTLEPASPRR